MEKNIRWNVINDLPEYFSGIQVVSLGNGKTDIYLCSEDERVLHITFHQIHALEIHEEFAHPLNDKEDITLPFNNKYAFPCIIVHNSYWITSFSDNRLQGDGSKPIHYRLISLSYYVDILSYIEPVSEWIDSDAISFLFDIS